jgi:hypothetical protein
VKSRKESAMRKIVITVNFDEKTLKLAVWTALLAIKALLREGIKFDIREEE